MKEKENAKMETMLELAVSKQVHNVMKWLWFSNLTFKYHAQYAQILIKLKLV